MPDSEQQEVGAIIVAAGKSRRMSGTDKIFAPLAGVHIARSVLADRLQGLGQFGLDEKIASLWRLAARLAHELLTFRRACQELCPDSKKILESG